MMLISSLVFAASPIVDISAPPDNVLSGQSAAINISIIAVPGITDVEVLLPSASAQAPSFSAVGVTSGTVTFEFSSVNRYNNGTYTVNFTNIFGSGAVDFQLTVYC